MKHKDVIFGLEKVEATPMRNGGSGVGLYNPHTSTFYLTTTLSTGYAECTIGFGYLGAACNPLVGRWTTGDELGAGSAQTVATGVQRVDVIPTVVDQIDLTEVTYDLGCPASVTDLDADSTGRLNKNAVDLAMESLSLARASMLD